MTGFRLTRFRTAGLVCAALTVASCSTHTLAGAPGQLPARPASAVSSPAAATGPPAPPTVGSPPAGAPAAPTDGPNVAAATGPAVDNDQQIASPFGAPTDDTAGHAAAVTAATTAMTAFTRTTLAYPAWYAQLEPLLSTTAAQAYAGTIPANIPAHTLTGPATYVASPMSTAYLARVNVPTNVGVYVVLLSRAGAGMSWQVERFTSPPGVGR